MKRLSLVLLWLFATTVALAQNPISVTNVNFQWPDSTLVGSTVTFVTTVSNDTTATYNDSLILLMEVDSGGVLIPTDSFNMGGVVLNGLDTASFSITHSFLSTKYAPGNNVVVIWPVNGSGNVGDSLTIDVFVIYPDGVQEVDLTNYIKVFPNPFDQNVSIQSMLENEVLNYHLYSSSGKLVKQGRVDRTSIDVRDLPAGMYSLELYTETSRTNIQLIKR